jgi:hypothetical protein
MRQHKIATPGPPGRDDTEHSEAEASPRVRGPWKSAHMLGAAELLSVAGGAVGACFMPSFVGK